MVGVTLRGVGKSFGNGHSLRPVLRELDLMIAKGEVVAIRGDNGSGKTTLLNMIVGIEPPTTGTISFDGLVGPTLRIGYVQQDYTSSLLPWCDVADNIAIPLRLQGYNSARCRHSAKQMLLTLGFDNLPDHLYPHQLSGGQKQRVAVARALIHDPHLLLLDEPFANLDDHTRRDLESLLSRTHQQKQLTILYVSHELDRCITLADRVLTIHGAPATIVFEDVVKLPRPRNRDVVLSPEYASIRARILAEEESLYGKQA